MLTGVNAEELRFEYDSPEDGEVMVVAVADHSTEGVLLAVTMSIDVAELKHLRQRKHRVEELSGLWARILPVQIECQYVGCIEQLYGTFNIMPVVINDFSLLYAFIASCLRDILTIVLEKASSYRCSAFHVSRSVKACQESRHIDRFCEKVG